MPSGIHHVWLADEDLGVFDEHAFTLSDAYLIEGHSGGNASGLSVNEFMAGINRGQPLAIQTLIWWLKFKQGVNVDRAAIDFKIADLRLEDEPDPTEASSGTGDAVTSDSSPTTAT